VRALVELIRRGFKPEVIGPPDCPIFHRWTFYDGRLGKLFLHHFLPWGDDRDVHDHPWPFVTIVFRGGYLDVNERGEAEAVKAPTIKYRPARHAHRTTAGRHGAWTIVGTGRKSREWGFWREGRWWQWREYERTFGFAMRCDDLPKEYRK
jgi:hypothetical protein